MDAGVDVFVVSLAAEAVVALAGDWGGTVENTVSVAKVFVKTCSLLLVIVWVSVFWKRSLKSVCVRPES